MADKKVDSQEDLDALLYAGATPYEDEDDDLSGLDRGDSPLPGQDDEVKDEAETEKEEEEVEVEAKAEPEVEAKADPEVEEEVEPAPEPKPEARMIPKQRFDEVNERRKAAERRNAELEAAAKAADPANAVDFDFDSKEEEYAKLVLDGDLDQAKSVRREIRSAEQKAYEVMADTRAKKVQSDVQVVQDFNAMVVEMSTTFPVFDPDAEIYDKELVDEAVEMQKGYVERGYLPAAALRKAASYVARANGYAPVGEQPLAAAEPEAKPKPVAKKLDLQKKLDAAAKQPPMQAGRGMGEEGEFDLDSIPEDEFDALPESKLRALRGDARM